MTKEYNIDQITTRTNIKGNSLIPSEENDEDNFITFVDDPRWENGSIRFVHVLIAALPGDFSVQFKIEKETFEEIANACEESIACLQSQHPDESVEVVTGCTSEFDGAKDILEETTKEVPQQSRGPQRKEEGSNYASIISSLLK